MSGSPSGGWHERSHAAHGRFAGALRESRRVGGVGRFRVAVAEARIAFRRSDGDAKLPGGDIGVAPNVDRGNKKHVRVVRGLPRRHAAVVGGVNGCVAPPTPQAPVACGRPPHTGSWCMCTWRCARP
ncbi:hypothetical protein HDU96_004223 [Phlyctochytrium bullatum]|nr:hypothetical protein HDU96_004223 [Phlyctochytrium bullatum]